ncbi:MAG: elongation factor P [bacterium]
MATTADIKKSMVILHNNEPHVVVDYQHVSPGKGSAFSRVRMKQVKTGKLIEVTYKADETVPYVDLQRTRMQYLYQDGGACYFMDQNNFETVMIDKGIVGDLAGYLKEGIEIMAMVYEGAPIAIEIPTKIPYKVTRAEDAVKGDTSGNVTKEVEIETGKTVRAPLFIKQGETIIVNTETGEYVSRAGE